jgi:hypothetical protein
MDNPQTFTGTGAITLTFSGSRKQVALVNTDAAASLNIKINGDTTGFTLAATERRGLRFMKGIYTIAIAGSTAWEVTVI